MLSQSTFGTQISCSPLISQVAPLKALCTEKYIDWKEKFESQHGLNCIEVTGDSSFDSNAEFTKLANSNIIFTTPVSPSFTVRLQYGTVTVRYGRVTVRYILRSQTQYFLVFLMTKLDSFTWLIPSRFKEKWDFVTRKMNNRQALMNSIKLFIVDEIHVMGENSRGAVIEAVVSRMKAYSASKKQEQFTNSASSIRFLAVSATIPNTHDVSSPVLTF